MLSINRMFLCSRNFSLLIGKDFSAPKIENKPKPDIGQRLSKIVANSFSPHPFSLYVNKDNAENVLRSYFAMSQLFPYIQAGAYQRLAIQAIKFNQDIPDDIEKTFVVANFLCWDETGANWLLREKGMEALPQILETRTQFHSNMLREDLKTIFGRTISPNYCKKTSLYLFKLGNLLGSSHRIQRCAGMVAFEMHAHQMISALWESLSKNLKVKKEDLKYFEIHVGGDDPAEAYHVDMTRRLINLLVAVDNVRERNLFLENFHDSYALNSQWCKAICEKRE